MSAICLVLILIPMQAAAIDAVLYLTDIVGGNTTPGREESIVVEAFSFSNSQSFGASFSPITIVKPLDQSTPKILEAQANQTIFPTARIEVFGTNPSIPLYKIELTTVTIQLVTAASGLAGNREQVALDWISVTWTYDTGAGLVDGSHTQ